MITLHYDSNNSGGSWWLSDSDWQALADAGWTVHWGRRKYDEDALTPVEPKGERWLGALACSAAKAFPTVEEGIAEWERITGESASAEGCNCCGPPHHFEFTDDKGETHYSSVEVTETRMVWN